MAAIHKIQQTMTHNAIKH